MRDVEFIIVHCSATPVHMDIGATEIRKWHTDPKPQGRGWSDIGYAYVIRRNGELERGRDLDGDGDVEDEVGAHAHGFNSKSIGLCLIGGVDENNNPESNFTRQQMKALEVLVSDILMRHPGAKVIGHHDVNPHKACPSFNAKVWWYG